MTRELFVSSTPHETLVGLVEDDQLAEVYLERENEYTLAGSIYKGRVTRVLPGMQSAFVDIGLERDAFLYVSDFMELENQEEDLDEVPTTFAPTERAVETPAPHASAPQGEGGAPAEPVAETTQPASSSQEAREERGGWRGRRRRRGRRDRGSNGHDRFPRGREAASRPERESYGPPPGYQPIILPGESISKYRDFVPPSAEQASSSATSELGSGAPQAPHDAICETFPQDEPLFAEPGHEAEETEGFPPVFDNREHADTVAGTGLQPEVGSEEWKQEQKRRHQLNVAAVFGTETGNDDEQGSRSRSETLAKDQGSSVAVPGTLEEEEIDEEEADLASYVEELEEDATFEELEEETHAAADYRQPATPQLVPGDNTVQAVPFSAEPISEEAIELSQAEDEVDEAAEEEAELEQAQAEAEALVDSVDPTTAGLDARAEVRAPSGTVGYSQRAYRPSFDRERRGPRRRGRRFRRQESQNFPQITDLLKEGQEILVQIAKEPIGKKGARITSHIALPGRFLVYMPTVNHTGVSRKIASEEERQRLKRIIQSERENGHGGFIVRTAAQGVDEQELRADIRFLKGLWNEIRTRAENSKSPALIYHDLNVVERVLRDQVTSDFAAIWVDSEQEYERILRFANRFQSSLVRRVKLYTKETPLFEQFGLREEIDKALKSKVWLKSGGYIVINQTEALVAIDVNTGKYVGKTARLEDTIVKTNVDAIREIVRQIRLRDLGGIIVIDFIDMDERRNRQKVMQALEEALRSDRSPSKVLQFNDFGLVAITRKRVKQSLERTIGSPCPYCEATGFVKNVHTVCNEIYVEMRKIAKQLEHSDVMLRVNPEVAKALKANGGRWLNELEELTKKTIIVKSDPSLHQEQFDIH
jgi:ribonuclease G